MKNDNSDIKENAQESLVQDNCIFQVSVLEYNQIMNGQNTSICNGYNELNINDVIINGQTIEIKAIIFNGSNHNLNENEGLFIGGKRVLTETYNQYKSNLNLVNNLLYIVSKNENAINVQAFNGVDIIYDLNKTLAELKIADQVFNLLAQTDSTINPILTTNNIDQNSLTFDKTGFTFNSDIKKQCIPGQNKGTTYKIVYINGVFNAPSPTGVVAC